MEKKFLVLFSFVYSPLRALTMASPPFCSRFGLVNIAHHMYNVTINMAYYAIGTITLAGLELLKERNGELVEDSAAPEETSSPPAKSIVPLLENSAHFLCPRPLLLLWRLGFRLLCVFINAPPFGLLPYLVIEIT